MPEKAEHSPRDYEGFSEVPPRQRSRHMPSAGAAASSSACRRACRIAALALLIAVPACANISPENSAKGAWIQEQANNPAPEAGELLQYLQQGYAPAGAQYGYGALPQQPPLVTTQTIEQAKELEPGVEVPKLSHKALIRQAALQRQLRAYAGVSPWFFVLTFLVTVSAVIIAFFFAKNIWSKRQDDAGALR